MKAIRLIVAIAALGWIGFQVWNFYSVEQHNEMAAENNRVVDVLQPIVETRDGLVDDIIAIFDENDGSIKEDTRIMMFSLMEGMLKRKADDIGERLDMLAANNDDAAFQGLVAAGHDLLAVYKESSSKYDEIIKLVVADPANRDMHIDRINELLSEANAMQDTAIDDFEAVRAGFEAERAR